MLDRVPHLSLMSQPEVLGEYWQLNTQNKSKKQQMSSSRARQNGGGIIKCFARSEKNASGILNFYLYFKLEMSNKLPDGRELRPTELRSSVARGMTHEALAEKSYFF